MKGDKMTVSKQYGVKEDEKIIKPNSRGVGAIVLATLTFTLILGLLVWGNIAVWGAIF